MKKYGTKRIVLIFPFFVVKYPNIVWRILESYSLMDGKKIMIDPGVKTG